MGTFSRPRRFDRAPRPGHPPLSLDDPTIVQAGARAFSERGCVNCHGGPGVDWAKFSEGMHPGPPDLKELANETSPQELSWVIKNGINMTGMPSFGAIDVPDQEIWSIVAFVKNCRRVGRRFQDLDPAVRMPHVKVTAECPEPISPSAISLASCTSCELSARDVSARGATTSPSLSLSTVNMAT
jgi:hypothetical protein